MSVHTFSSRDFTRDVSKAKRAAGDGPVLITDRAAFAGRIRPFSESTAPLWASMHVPDPRSERDAMIAATAMEHQFAVVTRPVADFAPTGVALVNPWVV